MNAAIGPLSGVTSALWLSHFGLQPDGLYWGTSAPTVLSGSLKAVRVSQDLGAILGGLTERVFLDEPGERLAYGGLGGGLVVIGVKLVQTATVPGSAPSPGWLSR